MSTKIEIDWKKLDTYLECFMSKKWCALGLGCSEDTIDRAIKNEHNLTFREYRSKIMLPMKQRIIQRAYERALTNDMNDSVLLYMLKRFGWGEDMVVVDEGKEEELASAATITIKLANPKSLSDEELKKEVLRFYDTPPVPEGIDEGSEQGS